MEPLADRKKRVRKIITRLKKAYPDPRCMLDFETPLELLVATILAAQCTDERVNRTTPTLFRKYRAAKDYAQAPLPELEGLIRSCGTFRNKAKAIKAACGEIVERHGGEVPDTMDELYALTGVGRKSANVIMGCAFAVPSVIVDTHVLRLSGRLGLATPHNVEKKYADKIERELLEILPRKARTLFSHLLAWHGRGCCTARKPRCPECAIETLCPCPDKSPPELFQ